MEENLFDELLTSAKEAQILARHVGETVEINKIWEQLFVVVSLYANEARREDKKYVPDSLNCWEEWDSILDQIIEGLRLLVNPSEEGHTEEEEAKKRKALMHLAYFWQEFS